MDRISTNNAIREYLEEIGSGASVSIRENEKVHIDGYLSIEELTNVVELINGRYQYCNNSDTGIK